MHSYILCVDRWGDAEGNGNLLQCSCLQNPMDRGAWWATVYGGHKVSDTTERLNNKMLRETEGCCLLPTYKDSSGTSIISKFLIS